MSQNITLWGASYSNVPSVNLPKTGGGTASFTDVTDTTATASDVAQGKYFYTSAGVKTEGTGSGGGGSSVAEDQLDTEVESDSYSITFSDLLGEPTSFVVMYDDSMSTPSGTPYRAITVVYDGTSLHGQTLTNTNNAQVSYDGSSFSYTYNNGTLTLTSNSVQFIAGYWVISYTYGGSAANVYTTDVQVGSGATSITFTGLEDEPLCWSCIFKSNFSTSSGYQRVIAIRKRNEGSVVNIYGFAMDSQAHAGATSWTENYNNGSLTITSQGTNAGGYFHQPGYYQLTYVLADASPYQKVSKTYRASTSAQSETITPSSGYDAIEEVSISIPAVSQTNLIADNIKSGTTISISNGQSNLWSVVGTYTGGGGGGVNVKTTTWTNNSTSTVSHQFTGLSGTPKAAFLRCTAQLTRSSSNTYYYIADIFWDGTNAYGNYHLRSNGSYNNVASDASPGFTVTTGTNSITFASGASSRSSAPGSFYNSTYELTYIY